MTEAYQTVKVVSRRSGLSAHVIRIWERRYGNGVRNGVRERFPILDAPVPFALNSVTGSAT